jgi:uncharacterized protein YdaU (DUF1376 family)
MNYYQHHIGDFDKATRHLSRVERSVYRDLIELYYDTEQPLTLDRSALCRKIIARSNEEVAAVEQTLNEFFTETATGWYHDRCETEIERYRNSTSQKAQAGKASALKRAAKKQQAFNEDRTDAERTLNECATNHKPITNNQEPINPPKPPGADRAVETVEDPLFAEFWNAYPKKVGKESARKAWSKIKAPKATIALVIDALAWQVTSQQWTKNGGQFVPNPTTYLNQHRWLDERGADATVGGMTPAGHAAANAASRWLESQEFPTERKTA